MFPASVTPGNRSLTEKKFFWRNKKFLPRSRVFFRLEEQPLSGVLSASQNGLSLAVETEREAS